MICKQCNANTTTIVTIEGRERGTCGECDFVWYTPRKSGGLYFDVVDEIADAVATNGHYEISSEFLFNQIWCDDQNCEQMKAWCNLHGFKFSLTNRRSMKTSEQFVQFGRKR